MIGVLPLLVLFFFISALFFTLLPLYNKFFLQKFYVLELIEFLKNFQQRQTFTCFFYIQVKEVMPYSTYILFFSFHDVLDIFLCNASLKLGIVLKCSRNRFIKLFLCTDSRKKMKINNVLLILSNGEDILQAEKLSPLSTIPCCKTIFF